MPSDYPKTPDGTMMEDAQAQEREELVTQLDELLGEGAVDVSDALEIATCAGLATRLGVDLGLLAGVELWKAGPGGPLLKELWEQASAEPLVDAIEGLLGAEVEERDIEDAFFDFDDFVAAAVWCAQREVVAPWAKQVAATVRMSPDTFATLQPYGPQMARLRAVGEDYGLYDYWFAVAEIAVAEIG